MTAVVNDSQKRRIAAIFQRLPWIGDVGQAVWRLGRPWVTIGAVGVVFNDAGQMLLVEHVFHPKFPWGLPGGWMDRHEGPEDTVRRELREETSLIVDVIRPLIITPAKMLPGHLDVAYLCHVPPEQTEVHLSGELLDYQWCDPQKTPPLGLFHRQVISAAIAEREKGI